MGNEIDDHDDGGKVDESYDGDDKTNMLVVMKEMMITMLVVGVALPLC